MSTAVGAETTKRAIGAPTIEEINRAYGGVVHVVSGSDFTETVEMAGHYFTFPPRGTCVINDIEDFPWSQSSDGKRRRIWERREVIETAKSLAHRMCSDEHYGRKGFMVMLGDGRDEERKLEARRRWVSFYEDYCRQVESGWVTKITGFRVANPSGVPPRQPRSVQHCQAWLTKLEQGLVDLGDGRGAPAAFQAAAICGYCSAEFEDEVSAKEHVRLRHPAASDDADAVITPQTVEAKKRRPAAEKDEDTAAAYIVRKAKALGVPLTSEELEGLVVEDKDVISAITARLARAVAGDKAEASEKRRAASARRKA